MSHQEEWINLLIDAAIAKNQHWIQNDHRGIAIDKVNSILASGLLIRAVSLLDESLTEYIDANNVTVSRRNPKLYDRLVALDSAGLLQSHKDIDSWRVRRNDVGHKVSDIYKWDEPDDCLKSVFRELSNLQIISDFPALSVQKKTQRVEPTKDGVSIEQEITVFIHEKDDTNNIYHKFGWRVRVGG